MRNSDQMTFGKTQLSLIFQNEDDLSGALFTLRIEYTQVSKLNVKRAPDMSSLFYFEMLFFTFDIPRLDMQF